MEGRLINQITVIDIVPVIIRDNNDIKIIKHSTQLNVYITILILFTTAVVVTILK